MKSHFYLFVSLLLFVCLFVQFSLSHTVYAFDYYPYMPEDNEVLLLGDDVITSDDITINYYMSDLQQNYFHTGNSYTIQDESVRDVYLITSFTLKNSISSGQSFDLSWRTSVSGTSVNHDYFVVRLFDSNWNAIGTYNSSALDGAIITNSNGELRYNVPNLVGNGAVKYIRVFTKVTVTAPTTFSFSTTNYNITLVSDSGKIGGIFETVKNIFTSIKNLPQNIANSLKGLFDSVVNAITNLGTMILDGIRDLFVPTQEDLEEYTDKWSVLLSDRFGCLYEVADMISEYVDSFSNYSENGVINIPSLTLNFSGVPFDLGGWDVDVVPDGFDFLFDSLKLAIDMVCTIAFVNGLKRRYDRLMERG